MTVTDNKSAVKNPEVIEKAKAKSSKAKAKADEPKSYASPNNLIALRKSWTANAHPGSLEFKFKGDKGKDAWNAAATKFKNLQEEMNDKSTEPWRMNELCRQLEDLCTEEFMQETAPRNPGSACKSTGDSDPTDVSTTEADKAQRVKYFSRHKYPRAVPDK